MYLVLLKDYCFLGIRCYHKDFTVGLELYYVQKPVEGSGKLICH